MRSILQFGMINSIIWLLLFSGIYCTEANDFKRTIDNEIHVSRSRANRDAVPPCNYEMPKKSSCEQRIPWKAKTEAEAFAICLDNFPTRFIKVKLEKEQFRCTVTAVYKCLDNDATIIYDKCYKFTKASGGYVTASMTEYIEDDKKNDNAKTLCPGGRISIFFSNQHIKFIARAALKVGIKKLWLGTEKDGRAIPRAYKNQIIHKDLWKVIKGDFWDGDQLKAVTASNKKQFENSAKYLFLRLKTDYLLSRSQGSFEQATASTKATFACEYPAYFQTDQKWYCDQLRHLGFEALYDEKDSRCVYTSTMKYNYETTMTKKELHSGLEEIHGCKERPSKSHWAFMDDGMAKAEIYEAISKGKSRYRLAGMRKDIGVDKHERGKVLAPQETRYLLNLWYLETSSELEDNPFVMFSKARWHSGFPINEHSTFPRGSYTLGLLEGQLIDMPLEVKAPVVCSLRFFKECELNNPCGGMYCTNKNEFHEVHGGYYTCTCPPNHVKVGGNKKDCQWAGPPNDCALQTFSDGSKQWLPITKYKTTHLEQKKMKVEDENIYDVAVRKGCTFKAYMSFHGPKVVTAPYTHVMTFHSARKVRSFWDHLRLYGYDTASYNYECTC